MKISEFIDVLKTAQETYGDLPLSTWGANISQYVVSPIFQGNDTLEGETPDGLVIEHTEPL